MGKITEIPPGAWQSLTQQYPGRVNVLRTEVNIGAAFDPKSDPEPETITLQGIWDTGASSTAISPNAVLKLGIPATGRRVCHGASGPFSASTYLVSLLVKVPTTAPLREHGGVWVPQLVVCEAKLTGSTFWSVWTSSGLATLQSPIMMAKPR
jgi:hypothetical protein